MCNERKILCFADYIGLLKNVIEKQTDQRKEGKEKREEKGGQHVVTDGARGSKQDDPKKEEGILLAYDPPKTILSFGTGL